MLRKCRSSPSWLLSEWHKSYKGIECRWWRMAVPRRKKKIFRPSRIHGAKLYRSALVQRLPDNSHQVFWKVSTTKKNNLFKLEPIRRPESAYQCWIATAVTYRYCIRQTSVQQLFCVCLIMVLTLEIELSFIKMVAILSKAVNHYCLENIPSKLMDH